MNTTKRRAVVYCRVSTDYEEQKTSLQSQRIELKRMCEERGWQVPNITIKGLAKDGVYYDQGTSGTKLSRPAFDRLLTDAGLTPVVDADTSKKTTVYKIDRAPKFDLVVVKDASRFSRNVSVNSIMQTLKDNHVYVYFTDLNMSTEVNEHWSIIQQFFIFAESESRRKSRATAWGYEAGTKQGKVYFGGKIFGYDHDKKSGKLVVNEKEAEVIRRVFDMYTEEGLGQHRICSALADEGFFNGAGKKYGRSTIGRWLENEKYCGITTGGRYHKVDLFSSKRIERSRDDELRVAARKAQKELEEQGIIRIPAIITEEQFQKAQQITAQNSELYRVTKEWHGTTDYSKKIICGCCGAFYRASGAQPASKTHGPIRRYICKHTFDYDEAHGIPKCTNPRIYETALDKELFGRKYWINRRNSIEELILTGEFYIKVLTQAINADNTQAVNKLERQISEIKEKRERLLDLYADGIFSKEELTKRTSSFTDQISALTAQREQLAKGNEAIQADIAEIKEMIDTAKDDLQEIETVLSEKKYPQKTRRELLRDVERIVIDEEGKPHITFRSLENIRTVIAGMGIHIESYADAEEEGWEEELAEFEK